MSASIFRSVASRRRWTRVTTTFVLLAWLVVPWHVFQQAWGGSQPAAGPIASMPAHLQARTPCDHCPDESPDRSSTTDSLHQTLCQTADAAFLGVEQIATPAPAPTALAQLVLIAARAEAAAFPLPPPTPPPRRHRPLHLEKSVLLI